MQQAARAQDHGEDLAGDAALEPHIGAHGRVDGDCEAGGQATGQLQAAGRLALGMQAQGAADEPVERLGRGASLERLPRRQR